MASNLIRYHSLSPYYPQPMHWSNFDFLRMAYNLKQINFVLHQIARHLVLNKLDLLHIACNLKRINFVLHRIAGHLVLNKLDFLRMACHLKRINFVLHRIAGHLMSNKSDLLHMSCNLIRNKIWPTHISRSKTSRRAGTDRKRESMWGCGMGIMKQRLILPAFWWCSDRCPPHCMKRESGESPEQCPLL